MAPTVSIITPAFNAERYIAQTIASVQSQSFSDYEHLIVDDNSTDSTRQVVAGFQSQDSRIQLLENAGKKGPAGARNTAILASRGRYLAFLDSDDVWYANKLAEQLATFRQTGAALVFSAFDLINEDGTAAMGFRAVPAQASYQDLARWNFIGCLTAVIDTDLAGRPLMPDIKMRQDWGLWLRVLRETNTFGIGIQKPLAALRLHRGSLSRNKLVASWYNFLLLYRHERLGLLQSIRNVAHHSFTAYGGRRK